MPRRPEGLLVVGKIHEQQREDQSQLLLDDIAILLGLALIATFAPLFLLQVLGWWPPNPSDVGIFVPPVSAFVLLGLAIVGLGWLGRSRVRKRQVKLKQIRGFYARACTILEPAFSLRTRARQG